MNYNNIKTGYKDNANIIKFANLMPLNNNLEDETEFKYKLEDITNPEGWNFSEIDLLGDMGFHINNEYDMTCDLPVANNNISQQDEIVPIKIYKNKDGYVIVLGRNYVFKTFNDMLNYLDKLPYAYI